MESVKDLNMEADDMQVVLSALSGISKRIKEVAQTHKPLFGGEVLPDRQGNVRAAVYQSSYLAGLPRQEDYPLHAVCRKDTLQGFGLGKDVGGELLF